MSWLAAQPSAALRRMRTFSRCVAPDCLALLYRQKQLEPYAPYQACNNTKLYVLRVSTAMQAATVLKGAALVAGLMLKDHAKAMPEPMVKAVVSLHDNALLVGPRA